MADALERLRYVLQELIGAVFGIFFVVLLLIIVAIPGLFVLWCLRVIEVRL